jgi:hypothetical protein
MLQSRPYAGGHRFGEHEADTQASKECQTEDFDMIRAMELQYLKLKMIALQKLFNDTPIRVLNIVFDQRTNQHCVRFVVSGMANVDVCNTIYLAEDFEFDRVIDERYNNRMDICISFRGKRRRQWIILDHGDSRA